MFAILITEENLPKIRETGLLSQGDEYSLDVYLRSFADWYFVRGYVPLRGEVWDHTVLPRYVLHENFQIDLNKAATDWDLIVRK